MKRPLVRSTAFVRAAKRLTKRDLQLDEELPAAIDLLGKHEGSYACSVGYDMRILFRIVEHGGVESILLRMIGTHDDVY